MADMCHLTPTSPESYACHMATINAEVAARVRSALAERGISNADFALGIGLADRTAARRLAGSSSWTLDELAATARFLGVPLSSLLRKPASQAAA